MTSKDLKNSILQFAVQGKLVPQNPYDEPASELLRKIIADKERLVKEKLIKSEKPTLPIKDEEKPFELPESWEWLRLGDIVTKLTDGTHYTPKYTETGIPFLSVKDMSSGKLDFRSTRHISPEEHKVLYGRCNPEKGDLLLTKVGTTGIPIIVDTDKEFSLFVSVALIKFNNKLINSKFLVHLINSPLVQSQCTNATKGVGNKNWVMRDIANTIIPLPPLAEQQRIVDKIEELMPLAEQYGTAESELRELNTKFPEQLKKSVLQYAVQGKLVPQNPQDESATVLLEKIKAEKTQLIKDKIIKQDKPLPEIKEEEIPFEIPDSWVWVRLGDIVTIKSSKRVFEKDYVTTGVPFYRSKEIGILSRKGEPETNLYISNTLFESIKKSYGVPSIGDLLITSVGSIGNTWIVDDRDFYYKDGNLTQIMNSEFIYIPYIEYFIKSPLFTKQISDSVAGTVYTALTIVKFNSLLFPLPPLSEQKLIVEKVEEVLRYCEKLK